MEVKQNKLKSKQKIKKKKCCENCLPQAAAEMQLLLWSFTL